MKQLTKPQYLIAIMAVLLITVSVVWLWVGTLHSNYHKANPNDTLHLGRVTKTSISSNPLSGEARQLEAKRLANWKENFPWKPTHNPALIFDASQPYNYLLTYDISKVTQEENRRIHRLWERRGQTESSIGRSHWFLRGFFEDDIRFTPQFEKFYQILKEHDRGHNPAMVGESFHAFRLYYEAVVEHEPDEYFPSDESRAPKGRFGYMTWADRVEGTLGSLRWHLSHWDWLRPRFATAAGKAEVESLISRLVTEIPEMDDLPKNIRNYLVGINKESPQYQALVNGEEQLLTPYVGWYQESAMLEAELDGQFRIHDASVWTFIQRDPESNPPARVELGRLVDHWGEPVEQCDSLKVSIINGENELIPVEVDADGFITIPTPEEIKRLRKNGGSHKAGPDEPSIVIQRMIAMDPKARRAEAERLAHWKTNFPWKPTHDPNLTFDPSQPYLYLHGVSGSHLTPEKKVEMRRQWKRRSQTEWGIGPNHAYLKKFFEDENRFTSSFETFCNILKEHDRGHNPVMVGKCFHAFRQYYHAAFEHEPDEYFIRDGKRVSSSMFGFVTCGEEAETQLRRLRRMLCEDAWLKPEFSTETGKIEMEGLITRLLKEIKGLDELPTEVMSYVGSLHNDSPEFEALMNGEDKLLSPYIGWYQECALKEVEEDRKIRIKYDATDPAINDDPNWSPPRRVRKGQLEDGRGNPVGNFEGLQGTMINCVNEAVPLAVDEKGRVTIPSPSEVKVMRQEGRIRDASRDEIDRSARFLTELGNQAQQGSSEQSVNYEDFQ